MASSPMQKSSQQWTDEQRAYLLDFARQHGLQSIAAAARMIVHERMSSEGNASVCPTCGQAVSR